MNWLKYAKKVKYGEHLTSNGRKAIETGIILLIDKVVQALLL